MPVQGKIVLASVIILMLANIVSPLWAAPTTSPFDHVSTGTFAVYNIADLTDGRQGIADALGATIRNVCGKDAWAGVWAGAAMTVSPRLITVKSTEDIHKTVNEFLHRVRAVKNLYVNLDYELVTVDAKGDLAQKITLADPLAAPGFHVTGRLVDSSQVIIANGGTDILIDSVAATLPKIIATPTVAADRKTVSIQLVITPPDSADAAGKPVTFSMPLDLSAGVQIDTKTAGQWLIIKAQAVERHWTPAGIGELIDRD
jgi:hypothetical protein